MIGFLAAKTTHLFKLRCGNWFFFSLSAPEFESFYNDLPRCAADGDEIDSSG